MQSSPVPSSQTPPVPPPSAADVERFEALLADAGTRAALGFLNSRTPHRFTGIFRFDGDMLRNVELVDKWDAAVTRCDDVPIEQAYCAHLMRTGEPLDLADGRADERVPWMSDSPVVSYCGAAIEDGRGDPLGALCHFDRQTCETTHSELPLLLAAARLLRGPLAAAVATSTAAG